MRICGVDFESASMAIVILDGDKAGYELLDSPKKISLADHTSSADLRGLRDTFAALLKDKKIERVGFRQCIPRGKYASGPGPVKMEAVVLLCDCPDLVAVTAARVAKLRKAEQPCAPSSLNKYQHDAFYTAHYALP